MKIIGNDSETTCFLRNDLIVLDKNVVYFELEKINNCSLIDAYKILYYRRKFNSGFFYLYCDGIFKNSPKYLQKIEAEKRWTNCVFIENIIAQYLIQKKYIRKDENWIYIGQHEFSGYRIIVGHGRGIILSRFLNDDIQQEIKSTLLYLRRIKVLDLKTFSSTNDISDAMTLDLSNILRYAENDYELYPISKRNRALILNSIGTFLLAVIVVLFGVFGHNIYELHKQKIKPSSRQIIENENLQLKVNWQNVSTMKSILENLNDNLDWKKIHDFCNANKIKVQKLFIEKGVIKIKTSLPVKVLEQLKKNCKIEYHITSDYKELGVDPTAEAVIWVK